MRSRATTRCKEESNRVKMRETTRHEEKNNNVKRRTKCEGKEKGKSGAKPHFIIDLGFLFFFRSNDCTHNNYFSCNGLHQHPQFFFPL
jgi:hypothetical protein